MGRSGGEGEDWPTRLYAETKKMKSLMMATRRCLTGLAEEQNFHTVAVTKCQTTYSWWQNPYITMHYITLHMHDIKLQFVCNVCCPVSQGYVMLQTLDLKALQECTVVLCYSTLQVLSISEWLSNVTIDASKSRDPDVQGQLAFANLSFTWYCLRNSKKLSDPISEGNYHSTFCQHYMNLSLGC